MLAERRIGIALERSTRHPLTDAEARTLLREVDTVLLLRGSAPKELPAKRMKPDDLRGPTGKIRAPLVRIGRTLLAGFRLEALEGLLAASATQPAKPSASRRKA